MSKIKPDQMSGLIWVQTYSKALILAYKELIIVLGPNLFKSFNISIQRDNHCLGASHIAYPLQEIEEYSFGIVQNSRICHECEGGIEKSVPRITVWHHEACRVMTNGDLEGRIFLSYPHTNNGLFFLLTIKLSISTLKKAPRSF